MMSKMELSIKEKQFKEYLMKFTIENDMKNHEIVRVLGYMINKFKRKKK